MGFVGPLLDQGEREEDIMRNMRWRAYDIFMDVVDEGYDGGANR
jgi:RecJ-like exonuclease